MNKGLIAALTVAALCLASIPAMSENSPAKVTSAQIDKAFSNPDARYRPFVRWWWNGDRVEADEIVRELRLMKEAGIGGVEINPISFPSGAEAAGRKSLEWLSDEWIAMLKTAFDEANRLGMTCDLIIGSGWPFGAETLPRDERASVMLTCAKELKGGQRFEISEFALCKEVDPGVTVNVIKGGEIVEKKKIAMPKEIKGVLKCHNPRCISSVEQELVHIFYLADEKRGIYRCRYCEEKHSYGERAKLFL